MQTAWSVEASPGELRGCLDGTGGWRGGFWNARALLVGVRCAVNACVDRGVGVCPGDA